MYLHAKAVYPTDFCAFPAYWKARQPFNEAFIEKGANQIISERFFIKHNNCQSRDNATFAHISATSLSSMASQCQVNVLHLAKFCRGITRGGLTS